MGYSAIWSSVWGTLQYGPYVGTAVESHVWVLWYGVQPFQFCIGAVLYFSLFLPTPSLEFCVGGTDGIQLFLFCEGATDGDNPFHFCAIGLQEGRQTCYFFSHCQNICDVLQFIYLFLVKLYVLSVLSFSSCSSYFS